MSSTGTIRRQWMLVASAAVTLALLTGCSPALSPEKPATDSPATEPAPQAPQSAPTSEVDAAAQLAMTRYELVRDGDYEAACALYSEKYIQNLLALAEAEGKSCAEAHELGVANANEYRNAAAQQGRLPLTPFFFVPSEIKIDSSVIMDGPDGVAFLAPGAIVNLDPTEFEDGVGKVPGWLGSSWVKQFPDGVWRFIDMTEN